MPENLEHVIVAAMVGLFMGLLIGITFKYPAELDNIQKYQTLCTAESHIAEAKIGIMGDIYSIKCANGIILQVHQ